MYFIYRLDPYACNDKYAQQIKIYIKHKNSHVYKHQNKTSLYNIMSITAKAYTHLQIPIIYVVIMHTIHVILHPNSYFI